MQLFLYTSQPKMVDLLLFYQHIHSMLIGPKEVVVISEEMVVISEQVVVISEQVVVIGEQVLIIRSDTSSVTTIFSAVCMHSVNTCLLLRKLHLVPFAFLECYQ